MPRFPAILLFTFALLGLKSASLRPQAPVAPGEPILDPPTVRSLGVTWIVPDSGTGRSAVGFEYRPVGAGAWRRAPTLLRAETGPFKDEGGRPKPPPLVVPPGAQLFAGSALLLSPDTRYQLRLTLVPAAGRAVQRVLEARTLPEPTAPANMRTRYVSPGSGGGAGSAADPFRGIGAADAASRPGDLFLLRPGRYQAPIVLRHSGEPGLPIIWRGPRIGEATIDAGRPREHLTGHAVDASNLHDVWFERLSICNASSAIRAHEGIRIVVRRCHLYGILCGVFASKDHTDREGGFFISDNLIEGVMPWPATDRQWHDLPESRGIWITGRGNVVCYNRIRHCKDGMDLDDCRSCVSNDFYNNDISEMFDDGCEMDGSDRNTRNFFNRYTNVLCGISFQPVYGGPVYAFRNVIYNIRNEPFKLHNSPSGVVLVNNTTLRSGSALRLSTSDPISNCYSRNNLLVGTRGRAYDCDAPARDCDFDFDGFAGWSGSVFLKWNGRRYATPEEVWAGAPIERHVRAFGVRGLFAHNTMPPANELLVADAAKIDVRLSEGSPAIGVGERLDGFGSPPGRAPDLGAIPYGSVPPHYGPRPER